MVPIVRSTIKIAVVARGGIAAITRMKKRVAATHLTRTVNNLIVSIVKRTPAQTKHDIVEMRGLLGRLGKL